MLRRRDTKVESSDAPLAVGDAIGGYRVDRIRARGCDRYTLAEAAGEDGKHVTLKVFPRRLSADEELRGQVFALSRVREAIDAPLLPVVAAGEDRGMLFVAHSVPRGVTLAELLAEGPLDPAATMTLLGQVAGGLETATMLGLPHGTLTPESILVTSARPRQALLLDYGIRPRRHPVCTDASTIEAADYCAPEAIRGAPAELPTSVYALTCILVECLTGAPPYVCDRPVLTLHAHLTQRPPRVSDRRRGLPAALDDVVATGLNKHPVQRHASPLRFMRAAQKAMGSKAAIPVPIAARRYVDAAAAAARRPAHVDKPKAPPHRPAGPERALGRAVRPAPAPPRRRAALWPAPAALGIGMALLASTAGFAAGHLTGGDTVARAPTPARQEPAVTERAAYVRSVDRAIYRLSGQRAKARRELRRARRASAQATHAAALADAYGGARRALAGAAGQGSQALSGELAAAQHAYRKLAAAAKRHDARAFRAAAHEVRVREQQLTAALQRLEKA